MLQYSFWIFNQVSLILVGNSRAGIVNIFSNSEIGIFDTLCHDGSNLYFVIFSMAFSHSGDSPTKISAFGTLFAVSMEI